MGRPRTATSVLTLKGAFEKNPQRFAARVDEPEAKGPIGPAPDYFEPNEVEAWNYLVGIAPDGVLGDCDRGHMEVAARLFAFQRTVPISEVSDGKLSRLDSMLGKMGLNPSERSKVKAPKAPPQNPFSQL